jgi:phage/plasmid-associated DNA primase
MIISTSDLKNIIDQYGEPAFQNKKGELSKLNDIFWAAYYSRSREKFILEPAEKTFYDYSCAHGIFDSKSEDVIRTELNALILHASRNWSGYEGINSFRNAENLRGTLLHLRGLVEERDFFNNSELLVHLCNCTLRFDPDGAKFDIESFSPQQRCRNRSPIKYDVTARCPEFEAKLLSHISKDDKHILQKYAGQCLLGRNLIQRFLILDGIGSSSKSAFVLVLNGIVGPRNSYQLRTKHLDDRFEIGRMLGRTLLIGPDVKGNFLSVPSSYLIKALVGGDQLDAELKGSNNKFHIYGIFNLVITSNGRLFLYLDSDQSAWQRRLLIARYEKPYDGKRIFEIDKYLLTREASGILNWCIEGLQMLLDDYTKTGDIVLPTSQQNRISDLLNESDSLQIFVSNEVVRDDRKMASGESYSLTTEEIVTEYFDNCVNVKDWTPISKNVAEKRLPDLMLRHFNAPKSHDLIRAGKRNQRGFWHVKWC